MGWFKRFFKDGGVVTPLPSFVTKTVNELRSGKIVAHRLDPLGISEMTVCVDGRRVAVGWYNSGRPRHVYIDGENFPGDGSLAQVLVYAACERAGMLLAERMFDLSRVRPSD